MKKLFSSLVGTAFCALLFWFWIRPSFEGDSIAMLSHARELRTCLAQDLWPCTKAMQYAPAQLLPSAALQAIGLSDQVILRVWVLINMTLFYSLFFWFWNKGLKIVSFVLFSGFAIKYANSTFSEMLTGGTAAWCVLWLNREKKFSPVSWMFFFVSSLSKETAPLFLAAFAIGTVPFAEIKRSRFWGHLVSSAGLAVLIQVCLNYFRFGSVLNKAYLTPGAIVEDSGQFLSFLLAQFVSPTAGLVWMWPSLIVFGLAVTWKNKNQNIFYRGLPWLLLFGLAAGFSKWAFPFGWTCWGPRFLVPWGILLTVYWGKELLEVDVRDTMHTWFTRVSVLIPVVILSLPSWRVLFSNHWTLRLSAAEPCPVGIEMAKCIELNAWPKSHLGILQLFNPAEFHPEHLILALLIGLVWFIFLKKDFRRSDSE